MKTLASVTLSFALACPALADDWNQMITHKSASTTSRALAAGTQTVSDTDQSTWPDDPESSAVAPPARLVEQIAAYARCRSKGIANVASYGGALRYRSTSTTLIHDALVQNLVQGGQAWAKTEATGWSYEFIEAKQTGIANGSMSISAIITGAPMSAEDRQECDGLAVGVQSLGSWASVTYDADMDHWVVDGSINGVPLDLEPLEGFAGIVDAWEELRWAVHDHVDTGEQAYHSSAVNYGGEKCIGRNKTTGTSQSRYILFEPSTTIAHDIVQP